MKYTKENFFVVVAFFNEEKLIRTTLDALAAQVDKDFTTILVDNNSTDNSVKIIQDFISEHPEMDIHIIPEKEKGTGAAADTGFRKAIEMGAQVVARTDGDAMPDPNWVKVIKEEFEKGALILGGKLKPRTDEPNYKWWDGIILPFLVYGLEKGARYLYNGKGYNYPMFMVPGPNMAIDAKLYLQVDGFPRSSIDDTNEDEVLHMKVRKVIQGHQAINSKKAIVYGSIRKAKAFGYIGIMLWYWNRKFKPKVIDVR